MNLSKLYSFSKPTVQGITNWEDQIVYPEKEGVTDYAYIKEDTLTNCTKEELFHAIYTHDDIQWVTTPEHNTFILPGTDYETLLPIVKRRKEILKGNLLWPTIVIIVFGFLYFLLKSDDPEDRSDYSLLFFILIYGIFPVISVVFDFFTVMKIKENNFSSEAYDIKFSHWINQGKSTISLYTASGILVLISVLQLIYGFQDSIELAGLVKPKVWYGEYWRLLTCTLLHGNLLHITFNASAIYAIGYMVIRVTSYWYFAIVFLFSGILGSLFSLLFLPEATSVGASGGIMGLVGFLFVFGIKFRHKIPMGMVKSMFITVLLTALMGILLYGIIDNAAHGGGLLGGMLMGILLIKKRKDMIPYKANASITVLGIIATLILLLGIGSIVYRLYFLN